MRGRVTRKKDVERLSCGFEIYIYEREETGSFLRLSLCAYLALHYLCIIFWNSRDRYLFSASSEGAVEYQ